MTLKSFLRPIIIWLTPFGNACKMYFVLVLKIALWRNIMQYVALKELLRDFTVFSLEDIRRVDSNFHRRRLNEWQDKGYITKIVKGYYIFSDLELSENVLFEIANRIYDPSYISFEMALSYHGLIPESIYGVTSASSRRTYVFKTKIASFSYRTINRRLFFGYDIVRYDSKSFKIATPEKALLDYFYLNPQINNRDGYASLRINREAFLKVIRKKRLYKYLKRFKQERLFERIESLWEFLKYA